MSPSTPATRPEPHLSAAAEAFGQAAGLIGPGREVKPVLGVLDAARAGIDAGRPQLVAAGASDYMLGEVDRRRAGADTLHASLTELRDRDGMERFDAAFAADEAHWRSWFGEAAETMGRAAAIAGVAPTPSS